jgi:predicted dehydrogenase
MSRTSLRIGVVGLGRITQLMHLPNLRELSDRYRIAGVCDVSPGLARLMAGRFGAPLATTDHRRLLSAGLDALLVAVPIPAEDIVVDALAAGVHVFVEKPMAWSPVQAGRVLAAAESAGRVLMVGYMKRHDPAYRLAERLVAGMGPVRGGCARCVLGPNELFLRDLLDVEAPDDVDPAAVRAGRRRAQDAFREAIGDAPQDLRVAYRGLLFLASHDLSLLTGLLGPARAVSSASTWRGGRWLATTLRFGDASVTYTLGSVGFRHFEELVELYGDEQTVSLSFPTPFLKHAPTVVTHRHAEEDRTVEARSVASYQEAFVRELEHFHDCVTTGRQPDPAAGEAADHAELMVAIVRAAATGRPQPLGPAARTRGDPRS